MGLIPRFEFLSMTHVLLDGTWVFLCLTVYDFDLLAGLMAGAIRIFHLF